MTTRIAHYLDRLGVSPELVGDLLERRAAGASIAWFWSQSALAVFGAFARDIRQHWVLALRSYLVGLIVLNVLLVLTQPLGDIWSRSFGISMGNYLLLTNHETLRWYFFLYHLRTLPRVALQTGIAAFAAWLVGRTHRRHQASMVVLFVVLTEAWHAWAITDLWRYADQVPKMNTYPYTQLMNAVVSLPAMLVAGLWGLTSARRSPREDRSSSLEESR